MGHEDVIFLSADVLEMLERYIKESGIGTYSQAIDQLIQYYNENKN